MGKRRRNRNISGKYVIAILVLWLFWFQNVDADASQMFFPFVCDDWIVFESDSLLAGGTEQKTEQKTEQETGQETGQEVMATPVKYDSLISNEDRQILYKVVSMECDTGYEGSLAVISCMLNRLESDKYPDDLMDVVTEKAQFTAYYDRKTDTYPYVDRVPSEECIAAVDDALAGKKRNLPSYILYFRSSEYKKLKGYKKYAQIGDNIYFYKEEDR